MARTALTTPGEDLTIGGDVDVIGTASPNEVITVTGGNIRFDPSFNLGGDTIDLPGRAEEYTAVRQGSNLVLTSAVNGVTITLPLGTAPNTLVFDNATRQVSVNGSNQLIIGSQVIDNPGGEVLDPGAVTTFQLTQGSDTDPQFTGTTGNDTYRADVVQTALLPIQTLTNGDNFNAGGGFDRLFAQVVNDVTPAGLVNLEEIIFEGAGGFINPPVSVDLVNANALQVLSFNSLNNDISVDNILTTLSAINLSNMSGPGIDIDIEFDGAAISGDDEELDINLNNFDGDLDLAGDPGQVYNTINVDSGGSSASNELDLSGSAAAAPNVNVTGGSDLEFRGDVLSFNSLRDFNAEALDANLNAVFTGNSGGADVEIDGAVGENFLVINGDTGAGLLTIRTQDGSDTLFVNGFTGDLTAELGEGNNLFDIDGTTNGNLDITSGDDGDDYRFQDVINGDVTVNAGDGDNVIEVDEVDGALDLTTGADIDLFRFFSDGDGLHTFGSGDNIDGGAGADRAEFEATTDDGVGSNRTLFSGGTIVGVEVLEHFGNIAGDLFVDLDGVDNTATRLELTGTYGDDVFVTNMDGETVAVYNDITDILSLDNAFLTVDDYSVEFNGGVTIDNIDLVDHGPTDEADRLTITSLGGGTNVLTRAGQDGGVGISTEVLVLTGDTDFVLGDVRATGGVGSNGDLAFDGPVFPTLEITVDATGASGDDFISTFNGFQNISDGDGNDIFALFWSFADDHDEIAMAGGSNAVWLLDSASVGTNNTTAGLHQVTGFDVTGAGADVVAFDHSNWTGTDDLTTTNGVQVANGDAAVIRNYEVGDNIDLSLSNVNFIRLTTQVNGGNITDAFTAAIGGGSIQVDALAEEVTAAYYDSSIGAAVFVTLDENGGFLTGINDGLAVVEMTYAEFLALDGDNLVWSTSSGAVEAQLASNEAGAIAAPAEAQAAADFAAVAHTFSFTVPEWSNHIV